MRLALDSTKDNNTASQNPVPYTEGTGDTIADVPEKQHTKSTRFVDIPDPGPRRYILDGLMPEGYVTMVYGDGGVAKSMLALSLGLEFASGSGHWLGRELGEAGPVLYFDFELEAAEQRRRVYQLAQGLGLEAPPGNMRYLSALGLGIKKAFDTALTECQEHGVRLLVVDSLSIALEGDAEAAKDVIGFFREKLATFRAAGVTVLVIDHQSRSQKGENYTSKSAFGSVFKTNISRSVIQIVPVSQGDNERRVRLSHNKVNFGAQVKPLEACLTFTEKKVTVEGHEVDAAELAANEGMSTGQRILFALEEGPMYSEEIAESTGILEKTVKNKISELRKSGEVEYTGENKGQKKQVQLASRVPDTEGIGRGNAED
jgi:hypothetical protein